MPFKVVAQSLAVTAALAAAPLLAAGKASFLGADVSAVAAGIVGFYPLTAAGETAKVLGAAWALVLVAVIVFRSLAARVDGRWLRLAVYPGAPAVAYAVWSGATMLAYPALYQDHLPGWLAWLVFKASFVTSPGALRALAVAALIVPAAVALLVGRRAGIGRLPSSRRRAAQVAALGLGVAALGWWLHGVRAGAASPEGRAMGAGERPNVLLIGVDSLRRDRLQRPEVTPALGRLANDPDAVVFDDHWVGVPRTFPSWIEIIQGRYAPRTGVRHMFPSFGARKHEFAGVVTAARDAGWRTAAVSDFAGDIFPRFRAGFDTIDAPKLTLQTMIRMSIDQLFPAFLPLITSDVGTRIFPALKASPAFADPRQLTDRVLAAAASARAAAAPFFLTAFYSTAHFPYAAPHPYYSLFADRGYEGPFRFQKNPELGTVAAASDEREVAQMRALYDGSVRAVDDEIGRLIARLKEQGLWERTIVVVTADHGEDLFEPGRLQGHGEHLRGEHVLRVPLIVKMPAGQALARRLVDFPTRSIDLAPTLTAALGLEPPVDEAGRGYDGADLMPWLRDGARAAPSLPVYSETGIWFSRGGDAFFQKKRLDYPGISGLLAFDQGYSGEIVLNPAYETMIVTAKHRSLIEGDYKIIYMPTPDGIEWELYDRRADPDGARDVARERPEAFARMRERLLAFVAAEEESYRLAPGSEFVVPR